MALRSGCAMLGRHAEQGDVDGVILVLGEMQQELERGFRIADRIGVTDS